MGVSARVRVGTPLARDRRCGGEIAPCGSITPRCENENTAWAVEQPGSRSASIRTTHDGLTFVGTAQFEAARYYRLAESKGNKTVGNSWYVHNLFTVCHSHIYFFYFHWPYSWVLG